MGIRNPSHFNLILAIARKDIAQAIKDRMILGVIIGVFLLILPSQLLPLILQNESTPLAVIYGMEPTALANALTTLPDTSAYSTKSLEDLLDEIASGRGSVIGLVLPEDYSEEVSAGERININGYLTHWTDADEASQLVVHFENKIQMLTDTPVEITIIDDQVYPDEDTRGSQVMFILQMINAIMTISLILVPQLMIIEKETHTLDALLISPASLTDLVIGKGLTGVFYAGVAVLIVVLMNLKIIAHWPLLIMGVLSGITLAVLTGLLIGLLFDNNQQATFAMWIVGLTAIAPPFILLIMTANLPKTLDTIVTWLPSGQIANLLLMSLMKSVDNQSALLGLGAIWIVNIILIGLNFWQIKQQIK
jgi:ABC-2 type transport system permease protein